MVVGAVRAYRRASVERITNSNCNNITIEISVLPLYTRVPISSPHSAHQRWGIPTQGWGIPTQETNDEARSFVLISSISTKSVPTPMCQTSSTTLSLSFGQRVEGARSLLTASSPLAFRSTTGTRSEVRCTTFPRKECTSATTLPPLVSPPAPVAPARCVERHLGRKRASEEGREGEGDRATRIWVGLAVRKAGKERFTL
eukprot:2951961-Rhodomonas_salina.1